MGKTTEILCVDPVTVDGKKFRLEFEHWGGEGYVISVSPWAQNTSPEMDDGALVLMGGSNNPGVATKTIDPSKRYSKMIGPLLKVKAIYEASGLIAACMKAYGKNLSITHAAVLSQMEGVDVDLLNQVAQSYWPDCPPPVG